MFIAKLRSSLVLPLLLAVVLAYAGCSSSSPEATQAENKPAANSGVLGGLFETEKPVSVPEGTALHVVLDQNLTSAKNRPGDVFEASVSAPVVVDGKTVIPKGARVRGRVVGAKESGRLHGVASLSLALRSVEVGGKSYNIETSSITRVGSNHNKRNIALIGGGAGAGALIGGLAGGGKGALIGSAVGAGAGTAGAAATGKKDIIIPAETPLNFRLRQSVTIPVKS